MAVAARSLQSVFFAAVAVAAAWFVCWLPLTLRDARESTAGRPAAEDQGHRFVRSDLNAEQSHHIAAGVPKPGRTYFFSIGDFGVTGCQYAYERGDLEENGGNGHEACSAAAQNSVAKVMERLSALQPQFILSLGDNFYIRGVKDLNDRLFDESFEKVFNFGRLQTLKWHIMLGDHDHCGNVTALLKHSDRSPIWRLPSLYYKVDVPLPDDSGRALEILLVDSVALEGGADPALVAKRRYASEYTEEYVGAAAAAEHWRWLEASLETTRPAVRLVAGHRPVVSIADRSRRASEHQVEGRLRELLAQAAAKGPVIYMNGHDHIFQRWQDSSLPLTYFGNGVGGMGLHPFLPPEHASSRGAELKWAGNETFGFAVHELSATELNTYFIGADAGHVLHAVTTPIAAA